MIRRHPIAFGIAALLALPPRPTAAEVRSFPGCGATLQACLDAADAGDVVQIAAEDAIDGDVMIGRSVTLEPAPGAAATLAGTISVRSQEPGGAEVAIRGLVFDGGKIVALQDGAGPFAIVVERNRFTNGRDPAVRIRAAQNGGPLGPVTARVVGNRLERLARLDERTGVLVQLLQSTAATVLVADNVIDATSTAQSFAVFVDNSVSGLVVDVLRNAIHGEGFHGGIEVNHRRGTATARIAGNLVTGARDGAGNASALSLIVNDGTLDATVVNNTFAANEDFADLRRRGSGVLAGTFANNIVALNGAGLSLDADIAATFVVRRNLVFGNVIEGPPGPETLIADPRFLPDGSFRLAPDSPARDAGDTDVVPAALATDLDGRPRVIGPNADLGAFELPCLDGSTGSCPEDTAPGPEPDPDPETLACEPEDCDDGDPCTADACTTARCTHEPVEGLAAALCVCERGPAAACDGQTLPPALRLKPARACSLLRSADNAGARRRVLARAGRAWARAGEIAAGSRARRRLSAACLAALGAELADARARTAGVAAD